MGKFFKGTSLLGFAVVVSFVMTGCGQSAGQSSDANMKLEPGQAQAPAAPSGAAGSGGAAKPDDKAAPALSGTTEVQIK